MLLTLLAASAPQITATGALLGFGAIAEAGISDLTPVPLPPPPTPPGGNSSFFLFIWPEW